MYLTIAYSGISHSATHTWSGTRAHAFNDHTSRATHASGNHTRRQDAIRHRHWARRTRVISAAVTRLPPCVFSNTLCQHALQQYALGHPHSASTHSEQRALWGIAHAGVTHTPEDTRPPTVYVRRALSRTRLLTRYFFYPPPSPGHHAHTDNLRGRQRLS